MEILLLNGGTIGQISVPNNGFMWTIGDSKTSTGIELYWGTSGTQLNLYTNDGSNITSDAQLDGITML